MSAIKKGFERSINRTPISKEEYDKLSPQLKEDLCKGFHLGILESSMDSLGAMVTDMLAKTKTDSFGNEVPEHKIEDLVAICIHKDDRIAAEMPVGQDQAGNIVTLANAILMQGLQVGTFVGFRDQFASAIMKIEVREKDALGNETVRFPYEIAANTLLQPPPFQHFYAAVFGADMCTIRTLGPSADAPEDEEDDGEDEGLPAPA